MTTSDLQAAIEWTAAFGELVLLWAFLGAMGLIVVLMLVLAVTAGVMAWRRDR